MLFDSSIMHGRPAPRVPSSARSLSAPSSPACSRRERLLKPPPPPPRRRRRAAAAAQVRSLQGILGGVVDPHAAYLLLRGIKTLRSPPPSSPLFPPPAFPRPFPARGVGGPGFRGGRCRPDSAVASPARARRAPPPPRCDQTRGLAGDRVLVFVAAGFCVAYQERSGPATTPRPRCSCSSLQATRPPPGPSRQPARGGPGFHGGWNRQPRGLPGPL